MLDLANERRLEWLATVIVDLRRAVPEIDLLLVGAMARDILLSYAHGIALVRATYDADLAFAVSSWDAFETLRQRLVESGLFNESTGPRHRLHHHSRARIDLIPFGGVEGQNGSIVWPPEYASVMDVFGFAEARASAIEVLLPGAHRLHVVALPMLMVLKIFAWADRYQREPLKDSADIFFVLPRYLDTGQDQRLYAEGGEAAHLLEMPDFDYRVAGAWLVGNDARVLVDQSGHRSERIIERLTAVLSRESTANGPLHLAGEARQLNPEFARRLLAAFLAGFSGQRAL